jgi:serine/threonine protein kinase
MPRLQRIQPGLEHFSLIAEADHSATYRSPDGLIVKIVPFRPGMVSREGFQREALIGKNLESPHTVQTLGYSMDDRYGILMMEDMGPSLEQQVKDRMISIKEVPRIIAGVATAIAHVHSNGYAHLDLKPENLYLQWNPRNVAAVQVGDFGNTRLLHPELATLTLQEREKIITKDFAGETWQWTAPEQQHGSGYVFKPQQASDMYALGKIAVYLMTGKSPQLISHKDVNTLPLDTSFRDFLYRSLMPTPYTRPSATELAGVARSVYDETQTLPATNESHIAAMLREHNVVPTIA